MIRIGLTQRVDVIPSRAERRDAVDQRWHPLLRALGVLAFPLPNDAEGAVRLAEEASLTGFILSGGNDIAPYGDTDAWAPERDRTERAVLAFARSTGAPTLGICRGMQMLNLEAGGRLTAVREHVGVRHRLESGEHELRREVNSYHSFAIGPSDLAEEFRSVAVAPDGTVEAMRHSKHPWLGFMWHPEREPSPHPHDLQMIRDLFGARE